MFDLIIYIILGSCIVWDIGLILYMLIESARYVEELDKICKSHSEEKRRW